ncbi:replication factor A protein 2 [Borealophlyctis nickersoniae]|nr:replication factor A protein 2 [Borealophlyctis nickersoniae]
MSNFNSPGGNRNGGGGSGGGFISPGPFGSQGGSPGGERGKRDSNKNQSIRHVMIGHVLTSTQSVPDAPFSLDGLELSLISFVGRINGVHTQSTHAGYEIDDGTGSVEVKKWFDNDSDDFDPEAFPVGRYVRVCGHLRSFNNSRNVVAFNMRLVESVDEISYHNLMALFTHLHLTKGPPPSMQGANNGSVQPDYNQSVYAPQNGDINDVNDASGFTRLQAAIMDIVQEHSHSMVGVGVDVISSRLRGMANESQIRCELKKLSEEGNIYTTTDDDHYKMPGTD